MATKAKSKPKTETPAPVAEEEALVVEATVDEESEPSTAQELSVVTEDTEIALPQPISGRGAEITSDDLVLPTIRIVQRVGALSEEFKAGSLIIDGEEVISDGKTPVEVTVIEHQKSFVENVPWGAEKVPNVLYSKEAVHALDATTEWHTDDDGERVAPDYWPTLNCRVLVKKPEDMEESLHFPFEFGGNHYAMVAWTLQRSGYTRGAKRILSAFEYKIFKKPSEGFFRFSSHLATFGANKAYVPEVSYGSKHPADLQEWIETMTS